MSSQVIRLGLDPGGSTGAAWFSGATLIKSEAILGGFDGFKEWWHEGDWPGTPGAIVMERYVPLEGFKGTDQTHSPQIEGAVKMVWERSLTLQQRSDKATLFRQHHVGRKGEIEREIWLASKGLHFETAHEMDAATHVLVERKRAKDMTFWKRYWK